MQECPTGDRDLAYALFLKKTFKEFGGRDSDTDIDGVKDYSDCIPDSLLAATSSNVIFSYSENDLDTVEDPTAFVSDLTDEQYYEALASYYVYELDAADELDDVYVVNTIQHFYNIDYFADYDEFTQVTSTTNVSVKLFYFDNVNALALPDDATESSWVAYIDKMILTLDVNTDAGGAKVSADSSNKANYALFTDQFYEMAELVHATNTGYDSITKLASQVENFSYSSKFSFGSEYKIIKCFDDVCDFDEVGDDVTIPNKHAIDAACARHDRISKALVALDMSTDTDSDTTSSEFSTESSDGLSDEQQPRVEIPSFVSDSGLGDATSDVDSFNDFTASANKAMMVAENSTTRSTATYEFIVTDRFAGFINTAMLPISNPAVAVTQARNLSAQSKDTTTASCEITVNNAGVTNDSTSVETTTDTDNNTLPEYQETRRSCTSSGVTDSQFESSTTSNSDSDDDF